LLSTLLLNYPARAICSYLARQTFADSESGAVQTELVPATARIPYLLPTFRVNAGIVLIVLIALIVYVITTRTSVGLSSIMMGRNAKFATYTGIDRSRTTVAAMTAS
ncbi:ABC transporter permease, partial [Salmonella enterica subsp. enterica serovar Senftenberg]|nr:ABC transporter permease [Salmonella enterica subsp. enterica serovar Senftenberg]